MAYENHKTKKNSGFRRLYQIEELEKMELAELRTICKEENIILESMNLASDKKELIRLIYKFRGAASDPFINKLTPDGLRLLQEIINRKEDEQDNRCISIPDNLEIFKGVDSLNEKGREYTVSLNRNEKKLDFDINIDNTNALLVNGSNDIKGILNVYKTMEKDKYFILLKQSLFDNNVKVGRHRNYSLIFFPEDFDKIVKLYNSADDVSKISSFKYIKKPLPEIKVDEIKETDDVLVIDYGSSFTTAGTYVDGKKKLVRFFSQEMCEHDPESPAYMANCQNCGRCELYPSIVAVRSCKNADDIELVYGYEARNRIPTARNSIFYDTKRWVNNYTEFIDVKDFDGITAPIKRSEIIKGFLLHVIHFAEQQNKKRYKNICFTSPVKQKALSIKMYQDVLQDCDLNVKVNDTIDEAVAVVYESVASKVENFDYTSGEEESILLIDCGGGTSDMVKCDYTINKKTNHSDISIKVGYANGDTNFGGNNLTYRIMQYVKIKLAQYYKKEPIQNIDELLGVSSFDIYDFVDEYGIKTLYENFEEVYAQTEKTIPTAFDDYKNDAESTLLQVKGNFYLLWNLAEKIKVEFYNYIGRYEFSFDGLKAGNSQHLRYLLSVRNAKGKLETRSVFPPVQISRDEINLLIKPEIYSLLKNFIESYYISESLEDITDIKLSGQTTKIDIFRDVLKEYIAGQKARIPFESSYSKKLRCINGAIAYHGARIIGRIRSRIEYKSAIVPYYLTVEEFSSDKEKVLIKPGMALSEIYAFVDRTSETQMVYFSLKDRNGELLDDKKIYISIDNFKPTDYAELVSKYQRFQNEDDRNNLDKLSSLIEERDIRLFVLSGDDSWGFNVVCVTHINGEIYYNEIFCPFENTEWEMNFFDGKR